MDCIYRTSLQLSYIYSVPALTQSHAELYTGGGDWAVACYLLFRRENHSHSDDSASGEIWYPFQGRFTIKAVDRTVQTTCSPRSYYNFFSGDSVHKAPLSMKRRFRQLCSPMCFLMTARKSFFPEASPHRER